jgi:hypothetical protein
MSESLHYQIAEALKARLASIVGDNGATYWYTPDRVVRVQSYDRALADTSLGMIYAIVAGEEQHREEATQVIAAEAEFIVLMLRPTQAADDAPFGVDESTKAREQDRMVRDFLKALWSDVTLGGLANNVVDGSLIVDRAVDVDGWAVVEARFAVSYSYPSGAP